MKYLINGFSGGFGRVLGRLFAYIFIGFIIYLVINYFHFDIKTIIPKINLGGFL